MYITFTLYVYYTCMFVCVPQRMLQGFFWAMNVANRNKRKRSDKVLRILSPIALSFSAGHGLLSLQYLCVQLMFKTCSTNINKSYPWTHTVPSFAPVLHRPSPFSAPSLPESTLQSWRLRRFHFDFDGDRHFGWQMHPTPNGAGVLICDKWRKNHPKIVRWNSKWNSKWLCQRVSKGDIKTYQNCRI